MCTNPGKGCNSDTYIHDNKKYLDDDKTGTTIIEKLSEKKKNPNNMKLRPSGIKYLCFQTVGITVHAEICSKSISLLKIVDVILSIVSFFKWCVLISGLFQFKQLRQHMDVIEVDQESTISILYKYKYMENAKKLFSNSGVYYE